jgi:hypothetical protein
MTTSETVSVEKLFPNVDAWGAAEWFERLVAAVEARDRCVLAGDEIGVDTQRMIASATASRIAREYADTIRTALAAPAPSSADLGVLEALKFIADNRQDDGLLSNADVARAALATREAQAADPAPVSEAVELRCTGCGSHWTDEELAAEKAADPKLISCCPERKMRPVSAPIAEADVLRAALAKAMQTLENYGDPSGYADGDGEVPEPDMGALARETVAEIRAVLNAERQP